MELANQIRRYRKEQELSQDELAASVFVSRQTVSNWETDKTYPDVQSLVLLSQLFDITIDELIQGDVALMRNAVKQDARKLRELSSATLVLLILSVVFFVALALVWRDPSSFGALTKGELAGVGVFVPLYALSMVLVVKMERLKAQHNLVTYREILAFANGEPLENEHQEQIFSRSHPVLAALIKIGLGATAGAFFGLMVYKLVS